MEKERDEIEEKITEEDEQLTPLLNPNSNNKSGVEETRTVKAKVPEVEIHLFRKGKGPIQIFKSSLGGYEQDQLEIHDILEKYGFKSIFAFNPGSGRGVPIRFNPKNGRSILPYKDGSVIYIDGEPKDSMVKPITKILFGVAVITFLVTLVMQERPDWIMKLNVFGNSFPPWIIACVVIVFTRLRKRTKDVLKKYGW